MTDILQSQDGDQHILDTIQEKLGWQSPSLDLSYERLGDVGVTFLARKSDLSHVRVLNLSWNEISDAGLRALGGLPDLEQPDSSSFGFQPDWRRRSPGAGGFCLHI